MSTKDKEYLPVILQGIIVSLVFTLILAMGSAYNQTQANAQSIEEFKQMQTQDMKKVLMLVTSMEGKVGEIHNHVSVLRNDNSWIKKEIDELKAR